MSALPEDEKLRRHQSVASNLGTHEMEGLFPDAATLAILRRYEQGDLTPEQFSAAMDARAGELIAVTHSLAGAA